MLFFFFFLGGGGDDANFSGNLLYPAPKQHLNNSYMVKNDEKRDGEFNHLPVFVLSSAWKNLPFFQALDKTKTGSSPLYFF